MNKKIKKIISVFLLFLIVFNFCGVFYNKNIYAEINTQYSDDNYDGDTIELDQDKVIKSSAITDYIGGFIFTIGNIIESLTSGLMKLITGHKLFPWADKIIFNTIPLLDVNFINPNEKSLLSTTQNNGIGTIVRDLYFTALSISLGFLGISVAIMAIRLAISTIASEKAKYKEAIVKWLTAIVLLFGMHFGLSLMFYINEQLVVIASSMLTTTMKNDASNINAKLNEKLNANKKKVVDNFVNQSIKDYSKEKAVTIVLEPGVAIVKGLTDLLKGKDADQEFINNLLILEENRDYTYALLNNKVIKENVIPSIAGNDTNEWYQSAGSSISSFFKGLVGLSNAEQNVKKLAYLVRIMKSAESSNDNQELEKYKKEAEESKSDKEKAVLNVIVMYYEQIQNGSFKSNSDSQANIIGKLGQFFKDNAWYTNVEGGGWSPTNVSVVSAVLYTIFVVQSLSFFAAYLKRFFYVVILSVLAPFVVIYDFFSSSLAI